MKRKQGISLIVLVITIIVIVILAVAVILSIANNNPIENAKEAVNANEEATLKEEATLLYSDWYTKEKTGNPTGKTASEYVKENLKGDYSAELVNKLVIEDDGTIEILSENSVAMKLKYGDYVKYIDAEGNERLASVLHDSSSENGLEIVLLDNWSLVSLPNFENCRMDMQKESEKQINSIYAVGARPLGGSTDEEYLNPKEYFEVDSHRIPMYKADDCGGYDAAYLQGILSDVVNRSGNNVRELIASSKNVFYLGSLNTYYSESNWQFLSSFGSCKSGEAISIVEKGVTEDDTIIYGVNIWLGSYNDLCSFSSSCTLIPVIKLRSTVEIASGDGTYDSPYIMKVN